MPFQYLFLFPHIETQVIFTLTYSKPLVIAHGPFMFLLTFSCILLRFCGHNSNVRGGANAWVCSTGQGRAPKVDSPFQPCNQSTSHLKAAFFHLFVQEGHWFCRPLFPCDPNSVAFIQIKAHFPKDRSRNLFETWVNSSKHLWKCIFYGVNLDRGSYLEFLIWI